MAGDVERRRYALWLSQYRLVRHVMDRALIGVALERRERAEREQRGDTA